MGFENQEQNEAVSKSIGQRALEGLPGWTQKKLDDAGEFIGLIDKADYFNERCLGKENMGVKTAEIAVSLGEPNFITDYIDAALSEGGQLSVSETEALNTAAHQLISPEDFSASAIRCFQAINSNFAAEVENYKRAIEHTKRLQSPPVFTAGLAEAHQEEIRDVHPWNFGQAFPRSALVEGELLTEMVNDLTKHKGFGTNDQIRESAVGKAKSNNLLGNRNLQPEQMDALVQTLLSTKFNESNPRAIASMGINVQLILEHPSTSTKSEKLIIQKFDGLLGAKAQEKIDATNPNAS
jgi:hypothetical protein